jgi:hypothetical protein
MVKRRAAVKRAAKQLQKKRKKLRGGGTVTEHAKWKAINRKSKQLRKPRTPAELKKARKTRTKRRARVRKREAAALQRAERAPASKPYVKGNPMRRRRRTPIRRRKNAKLQPLQKLMNWTKKVQKSVEKVPGAKHFAWAIPAAALGYGTYYLQSAYTPPRSSPSRQIAFCGGMDTTKSISHW